MEEDGLIGLTAMVVANYVANNSVATNDVAFVVKQVHGALSGLGQPQEQAVEAKVPVVSIRSSVKPDYIVCMECGKKQKTLKRHLQTAHGMTPNQYRAEFRLPPKYPMTSPSYSARRGEMARAIGLGRKKAEPEAAPAPAKSAARIRRAKKKSTPSE